MAREIHPDVRNSERTFDDLILAPIGITNIKPSDVDISIKFTKHIDLRVPIIGSPMDTVTEARMAILLARLGGIGVIHSGLSIERQLEEITKVRKWEAGFVLNPQVIAPDVTVAHILELKRAFGFSSYPVTADGTLQSKLVGMVTEKDIRDRSEEDEDLALQVSTIMTPRRRIVYGKKSDTLDKNDIRTANAIIRNPKNNLDTLPILDSKGRVVALVTRSDLKKDKDNPLATKDANKQLQVMAAVESRPSRAIPRIEAIANSGISGIVIDSRNIYKGYKEIAEYAKCQNPNLDVIVGNIVDHDVLAQVLEEAGYLIDGFRVGIGTGEVCITSEELGVGRAMASAMIDLDNMYRQLGGNDRYGHIGFIPDGGIKYARHFIAGSALHSNFAGVMMGSVLAGFDESPGKKSQKSPGTYIKHVRGMGSIEAIADRAGASRYGVDEVKPEERFAEGIDKAVPAIGSGEAVIKRMAEGIRTGYHALNAGNHDMLYAEAKIRPVARASSKGSL